MRGVVYIAAILLLVGCSSGNLVEECGKNFHLSVEHLHIKNREAIYFEVLHKRYKPYRERLFNDIVSSDSIQQLIREGSLISQLDYKEALSFLETCNTYGIERFTKPLPDSLWSLDSVFISELAKISFSISSYENIIQNHAVAYGFVGIKFDPSWHQVYLEKGNKVTVHDEFIHDFDSTNFTFIKGRDKIIKVSSPDINSYAFAGHFFNNISFPSLSFTYHEGIKFYFEKPDSGYFNVFSIKNNSLYHKSTFRP